MKRIAVISLSVALSATCFHSVESTEEPAMQNHCDDKTAWWPENYVLVKNGDDAKRIAFAMWRAYNPSFAREDEAIWATGFIANLRECVWTIAEKPVAGVNGTIAFSIGANDGRYLGARISD